MSENRWRLDGCVALVTGASKGIGRACVDELLGFGADVLMVARDDAVLEAARAELAEEHPGRRVLALAADQAVEISGEAMAAQIVAITSGGTSCSDYPSCKRAIDDGSEEDERRIAYVAFTRARDALVLAVPQMNEKGEQVFPSRYIRDAGLSTAAPTDDQLADDWWRSLLAA